MTHAVTATYFHYIDTNAALTRLCERLAGEPAIGFDTEFMRHNTYYPKACLIQLSAAGTVALIDPLASLDLAPLGALLAAPTIIKVAHAARQDLEVFLCLFAALPEPLFDTQVAGALCGFGDQRGYATLVNDLLGVELAKEETRTDWAVRPLSGKQLHYAADDVRYLLVLHERLADRLAELGRSAWLEAECQRLLAPALYDDAPARAYQRARAGDLPPAAQQRLKNLWEWRERLAQARDKPREWIVREAVLLALAQTAPRELADLDTIPGLAARTVRQYGAELLATLRVTPPAAPVWPAAWRPDAAQQALLKRLRECVQRRAAELNLPAAMLATRAELNRLVIGDADLAVLNGWRRSAVGEALLAEVGV